MNTLQHSALALGIMACCATPLIAAEPQPIVKGDGTVIEVCPPDFVDEIRSGKAVVSPAEADPPPSPAAGRHCWYPMPEQQETRADIELPRMPIFIPTEEECRVLGLQDKDCPPRWPAWMKREKGIPE